MFYFYFTWLRQHAAMIAAAANFHYLAGQRDALAPDARPNWKLT